MRLIISLLLLLPVLLLAQAEHGIKAEYIFQNQKSNKVLLESYLISHNAALGVQVISPPEEPVLKADGEGNLSADLQFGPDREENQLYYSDYKKHQWIAKLFIADESFIVSDSYDPFNWEITTETKVIAGYSCYGAKTSFRGRDYIAYFTPEIPLSSGPYKFGGLPGLILEIKTSDEKFAWFCRSISKISPSEIKQIVAPTGKKAISQEAYKQESIRFLKQAFDRLRNLENITIESEPVINEDDWLELSEKQ